MENIELKKTPYNQIHHDLGAKMAEFAGYDMPIQYTGLVEEHNNVRNNVGVFDVSHMGEFRAKGPMAKQFMQYCTVNDVAALSDGKVQYTCLPNGKGGIVDDMLVYRIADDHYFMVPNAANIDKDWAWMSQIAEKFGMTLGEDFKNESEEWAQLAVQGPNALKAMQKLTKANVVDMEYYTFQIINFAGVDNVIFSTTGYTGSGGCEIYIPVAHAKEVWDAVFEAGKEFGIMPAGLGCRDTLRLEKGFCLYGHEIDDTISPIEAGLGWITKFVDGNDFIDRPYLEKQKAEGVTRKLVHFELTDQHFVSGHSISFRRMCVVEVRAAIKAVGGAKIPRLHVMVDILDINHQLLMEIDRDILPAGIFPYPFYLLGKHREVEFSGVEAGEITVANPFNHFVDLVHESRAVLQVLVLYPVDGRSGRIDRILLL